MVDYYSIMPILADKISLIQLVEEQLKKDMGSLIKRTERQQKVITKIELMDKQMNRMDKNIKYMQQKIDGTHKKMVTMQEDTQGELKQLPKWTNPTIGIVDLRNKINWFEFE